MPPNSCSSSGYGTVGGSPSQARIFMCDLAGAYAHEVGHNLGMHHASTPAYEFEDTTDPMAISGRWLRGLNAPHRHQMEWYGSNSVHLIDRSGTYDVAPLAMDPGTATAPQVLLIRKPDTGEYYYVSYRMPIGFDDQYIDLTYLEKLSIHRYKGDGTALRTSRLAGLQDGETFRDTANGLSVTLRSHASTHEWVDVQFDTSCQVAAPSLNIGPSNQTGQAGSTLQYAVLLTNKDESSCGPSTFDLNATIAAAWQVVLSSNSLTLAPGSTGSAELTRDRRPLRWQVPTTLSLTRAIVATALPLRPPIP